MDHNLQKAIGNRVRALREGRGLSQAALGDKLETSQKSVSQHELGQRNWSFEDLIKVSSVLDCSLDYLICGCELEAHKQFDEKNHLLSTSAEAGLQWFKARSTNYTWKLFNAILAHGEVLEMIIEVAVILRTELQDMISLGMEEV